METVVEDSLSEDLNRLRLVSQPLSVRSLPLRDASYNRASLAAERSEVFNQSAVIPDEWLVHTHFEHCTVAILLLLSAPQLDCQSWAWGLLVPKNGRVHRSPTQTPF